METYRSENSGIVGYRIGTDYIDVQFKNGGIYRYEEAIIGHLHFLNMQAAAIMGNGLNAFINNYVRAKAIRIRY